MTSSMKKEIIRLNTVIKELEKSLKNYKRLESIGNVYRTQIPTNHKTVLDMLIDVDPTGVELYEIRDMKFNVNTKRQSRHIVKYNKNINLLTLSKKVAADYKRKYKRASPRVKNVERSTHQLASGRNTSRNVFPMEYVDYIRKYLIKYPLQNWGKKLDDPEFEVLEDGKLKCRICECIISNKGKEKHKESNKHIKNSEKYEMV